MHTKVNVKLRHGRRKSPRLATIALVAGLAHEASEAR
jgi:hypothetical protein